MGAKAGGVRRRLQALCSAMSDYAWSSPHCNGHGGSEVCGAVLLQLVFNKSPPAIDQIRAAQLNRISEAISGGDWEKQKWCCGDGLSKHQGSRDDFVSS